MRRSPLYGMLFCLFLAPVAGFASECPQDDDCDVDEEDIMEEITVYGERTDEVDDWWDDNWDLFDDDSFLDELEDNFAELEEELESILEEANRQECIAAANELEQHCVDSYDNLDRICRFGGIATAIYVGGRINPYLGGAVGFAINEACVEAHSGALDWCAVNAQQQRDEC